MRCRYRLGGLARGTTLAAVAVSLSLGLSACQGESSVPQGARGLQPEDTSIPAEPTPAPQTVVTVPSVTTYEIRVASVRRTRTYGDGTFQTETAPAGSEFIVVTVREKNIGDVASNLEQGNSNPFQLVDGHGRVYDSGTSWSKWEPINPGLTQDNAYSFTVPAGTVPAHLLVNVTDPDTGAAFYGALALNGDQ